VALKLVRTPKEPKPSNRQKSREEYLVACLSEEANDPKFTDWEKNFILSLTRQVGRGRKPSSMQKEILQRLWKK
jgi:predicted ATP-binding protein involved in virulence